MMKIVNNSKPEGLAKPNKRIPLYKNKEKIRAMAIQMMLENNAKLRKQESDFNSSK